MTDLDELDRLAKAASPGPWCDRGFGSIQPESGGSLVAVTVTKGGCLPGYVENSAFIAAANPAAILALTAEVRRLRAALSAPIAMGIKWSPIESSMMSGFSQIVAEDALTRKYDKAKNVTVYYGEKRTYTSMAAFRAAHPKEGV